MKKRDNFSESRRTTLKVIAGATTASLLGTLPAFANTHPKQHNTHNAAQYLNATIISRADASRNYLMLQNHTDHDIAVTRFADQLIRFDNTTVNMADAFVEPIVVHPKDRVMVRLKIDKASHPHPVSTKTTRRSINLNNKLKLLPQGTRVVEIPLSISNTVATIQRELFV